MQEVLASLMSNQILYSQNVLELKAGIAKRYPDYSKQHTALLFASAIHKIIGKHTLLFDKGIQNDLKIALLQQAVKKDVFAINAYDIFAACIALDLSEEAHIENLTNWINTYQDRCLSKDELFQLVLQLKANEMPLAPQRSPEDAQYSSEDVTLTLPSAPKMPSRLNTLKDGMMTLLNLIKSHNRVALATTIMTLSVLILFITAYSETHKHKALLDTSQLSISDPVSKPLVPIPAAQTDAGHPMPQYLQYKEIDTTALLNWLKDRDSMLAHEPYFSSIIAVAKEYNINPLLMFAITGQEQAFVPRSNVQAASIANNPFNVYGSWEDFNTDITDTSKIAARTLITLSQDRPDNMDAVQWINRKYAEDPNWHQGVSEIFVALEEVAGN